MQNLFARNEFVDQLRKIGDQKYHDKHPFHVKMNSGQLSPHAIRGWVANRFYYQQCIPRKDAAILSNCTLPEFRRIWIRRIHDQDGFNGHPGGIDAWLRLGEACGIPKQELLSYNDLIPGVKFAVDAYVHFAQTQPWPIAMASSLTELFAPDLMSERLTAFQKYYDWIPISGLDYFRKRLTEAKTDSEAALEIVINSCTTREMQEQAIRALSLKCEILWTILDSIHTHYGD